MTTESESGTADQQAVSKPLWVVRGATIGSVVSTCALYPPWEWLDNLAAFFFLIVPLGLLSGAILWRVRRAPYRDGLALAVGSGVVILLGTVLVGWVFSQDPQSSRSLLAWFVFFGLAQACQVGGAVTTHWAVGRASGDWTLFAKTKREEESIPSDGSVFARPLWCVRGAAIGTLVLLCVSIPPRAWADGLVLFLILVLGFPFLVVLWRLRRGPRRNGLCLAMGMGMILSAGLGVALLVTVVEWASREWAFLALAAVAQVIMATNALVAYGRLPKTERETRFLVRGFVDPLVYFGLVVILGLGSSSMVAQRYANRAPEEAVAWLKTVHTCAAAYAAGHPAQGFPVQLDQLGPQGARCLEPLSPQGERSGYAFTYSPAAPEPGGRIIGYHIVARPVDRVRSNQQRFLMDQSGAIRVTRENRDPTPQDPIRE